MTLLNLPADWGSRLSRYAIGTKAKIKGHHKGSHRSMRFGSSLDFSDFREYHPGDDVRHIDWNVYARTERIYIKRFLDEQEMRIHILLDSSKSMDNKWLFAKQLAFSLGLMVLGRDDRLTVSAGQKQLIPFRKKGKSAKKLFEHFVSVMPNPENVSFASQASFHAAKDSTVLFIVSDGLEPLADWQVFFRQAPTFAHDIRFIHLTTQDERLPSYKGDLRFIDDETQQVTSVTVTEEALRAYQKQSDLHSQGLESLCRTYGIAYLPVHVEDGIEQVLFHQMIRKNWIR
ncbi:MULTISPECIES: DUF58 domain-containing protein [Planococcus]|uniref:DUF58 domain-containing protein n=1 Tax=Planococcus faecalis TaxID=1598147 RepID=A0ABM6ITS3_9BACL|nr:MULTISPECIES: DUF58 domain-containing protein [Planococcus]AQU79964.1 hypothetical protein AJGP001_12065 [Planococcus faecalis]MDJ0330670.1 DUF58 domain-containing protein [Planococcus sp. S3-L1]OHX53616.1 hypothetical protein BB777_03070 [Planococcus faecalis]